MQWTLFQLDDYGPWTTTPHPRREMDLQTLQSRIYATLATGVDSVDGYVFPTRWDNLLAVTNGLDREGHERLQTRVRNRFPVTLSCGVGVDETPATAIADATAALQDAGSAQGDRREALRGSFGEDTGDLTVAHFDVVDATGTYTDRDDAYSAHRTIRRGCDALADEMHERHGALTFFVGGDNAIAVCPAGTTEFGTTIDRVQERTGTHWRVGVGHGATAHEAGMAAKHALEAGRERAEAVVEA
ncbi:GTP cyclohydrolase IIa [Haloarchaeobius sp. HME9146]|uniref:GTP cyclohydrolase IIa n=1 Tax=Haloarchaeobius sp. HME9146 TaxID=2978732 RepID=UPI0021C0093C|nr:GTP cyclohydrolase IIa [Haloarchaeobius sp. HME9146]MCT9097895.1 GTP cyclohydrolase IIa [Haloarchaeobius sp. HME9146]